jgi:hypothetical protein
MHIAILVCECCYTANANCRESGSPRYRGICNGIGPRDREKDLLYRAVRGYECTHFGW